MNRKEGVLLHTNLRDPKDGVEKVQAVAKAQGWERRGWKINQLAYNPFERSTNSWWLAPTGANPAYKFAKIKFAPPSPSISTDFLFVGLNLEKGVTGAAVEIYRSLPVKYRRYIMESDWAWHRLIGELRSGSFVQSLQNAQVAARGVPVTIVINVAEVLYTDDPRAGEAHGFEIPRGDRHEVQYSFDDGSIELTLEYADPASPGLFKGAAKVATLVELADMVAAVRPLDWSWVDFLAGHHFLPSSDSSSAIEAWDAEKMWERTCLPWRGWVWP